jgi:hypothetical protein
MTPPLFTHPLSIFVLVRLNMDSSHNLRMIHEGRTIVTILVSAGVDPSCLGSSLPGPAVSTPHLSPVRYHWFIPMVHTVEEAVPSSTIFFSLLCYYEMPPARLCTCSVLYVPLQSRKELLKACPLNPLPVVLPVV